MNYIFYLMFITSILSSYAQTVKLGDNIKTEFSKISSPYYFEAPNFTSWIEGEKMFMICEKQNPNDCDFIFLALNDTTLIGVYKTKEPHEFMFDTDGNSILDNSSEFFLLPLWVVKKNTQIDSYDKTVLSLLDKLYEKTLQANEIELDETIILEFMQYRSNTRLANRHIALLFDNYQSIITEASANGVKAPADICILLMKSLSIECVSLFDSIPAIVLIYMGEALENAGMTKKARDHVKMSLHFYPNSIPLKVYNYLLEEDPAKKKYFLNELKQKYAKHWMVRGL